jgi:hypothetical protein
MKVRNGKNGRNLHTTCVFKSAFENNLIAASNKNLDALTYFYSNDGCHLGGMMVEVVIDEKQRV